MRRITKRLVTVLFPLALVMPAASILIPVEPVEIENRRLEAPAVSPDRLLDPRFYREIGAYIRDANPVRTLMIRAGTGIDYHLFGDSPNPLATLVSDDGWLFRREYMEELCEGSPVTAVANLRALIGEIESTGATVVYTVAPAKFTVVPEYLSDDQARLAACGLESAQLLRTTLASEAEGGYVDGWALFSSMRALGIEPYFKTDTHFNYVGSVPWMQALITAIRPEIWDPDAVRSEGVVKRIGNIATQIGLDVPEEVRRVIIDRGVPRTPVEQLHDRFSATRTATQRYQAPIDLDVPLIEGRAIMLADSFIDIPAPSFVQYFEDITIMDWRSQASINYFLELAHTADIVLIETSDHGSLGRFQSSDLLDTFRASQTSPAGSDE